jgi:hypothetical protein
MKHSYDFGERLYNSGYRYGFNGMEKDDEVNGSGNSYDFGERLYNGGGVRIHLVLNIRLNRAIMV